jgi:uncharacterized protein YdeI (YjbR/CyaY-like superfamily)
MTERPHEFLDQNAWEHWLTQHGETSAGIWLRLAKKGKGPPSLTYGQAVESALCHGWIDGQKKAESDDYWLQRFTPRTAKSIWSKLNCDRVEALIAAGRMLPSGMREIEASAFFATLSGRNRYAILFRLQNAKRPETRLRKIEEFVGMLGRGETIHP